MVNHQKYGTTKHWTTQLFRKQNESQGWRFAGQLGVCFWHISLDSRSFCAVSCFKEQLEGSSPFPAPSLCFFPCEFKIRWLGYNGSFSQRHPCFFSSKFDTEPPRKLSDQRVNKIHSHSRFRLSNIWPLFGRTKQRKPIKQQNTGGIRKLRSFARGRFAISLGRDQPIPERFQRKPTISGGLLKTNNGCN